MTLPIEAILALLTLNGVFISAVAHLGLSILRSVNTLTTCFKVAEAETKEKMQAVQRHLHRNQQETDNLRRATGPRPLFTNQGEHP